MCIINDSEKIAEQRQRMTVLQLWKVISVDDSVGLWYETSIIRDDHQEKFHVGEQVAHDYHPRTDGHMRYETFTVPGAFHCCFTRKAARSYLRYRKNLRCNDKLKIIKVYASSNTVVSVGADKYCKILAISIRKMTIKSLKHQR